MSTQKSKIKNPMLAKRTRESILAEIILCKVYNWKIEFLSGGYESYRFDELKSLIKDISQIYGEKVMLNIGVLKEDELKELLPYIEGVSGAVECITPKLRDYVCPSKPLDKIEQMFKSAKKLGLKSSMTLILGLGEKIEDFKYLSEFIKKNDVDQITFYRLKPQKGTAYENAEPITKEYYESWVKLTRKNFPDINIIVGSWIGYLDEITNLLRAGADGITKFPSLKLFNSKFAHQIKDATEKAGCKFMSNLSERKNYDSEIKKIHLDKETKEKIISKLNEYQKGKEQ